MLKVNRHSTPRKRPAWRRCAVATATGAKPTVEEHRWGLALQAASSLWCGVPRQRPTPGQAPAAAAASPATDAPNQPAPMFGWHQPHRHSEHLIHQNTSQQHPQQTHPPHHRQQPRPDSVVRSAIKAENAVPPAAIAVPIPTKTRINRPISSPFSSPPEASMLMAKRSTTKQ